VARTASNDSLRLCAARLAICLATAFALLFAASIPVAGAATPRSATAGAQTGSSKKHRSRRQTSKSRRRHRARRARARRLRRASRNASLAPNSAVSSRRTKASPSTAPGVLDAGFESGLFNWNTAGVGEAMPTVVDDIVRSGGSAGKVLLTGNQTRSELILGGNGGGSTSGMVEFHEGDEYWYSFFKGDDDGSPAFGLQLWDYEGDDGEYAANPKGLWSHGPSMGGDRFLAPVGEGAWHDIVIHFKASAADAGFYELYLDGNPIDSRSGVSMIADGADYAYIKDGLYRNGDELDGTSELRLDAAKLGHSLADVS